MLSVARRYYNRELESVDESTKQELCLLGLPPSMRVVRKDGNSSGNSSSRGSSQEAELYAAFAGTTNGQGKFQHDLSNVNLDQSTNFDQSANFFAGMDLSMDMANWQIPDATLRQEGNPNFDLSAAGNGLNNYGSNMPPGIDQLMFGQQGWNGASSDARTFHQGPTDVGSLAGMGSGLGMFSDMPLGIDLVMGMGSGSSMGSGNPSSRDSPGSMGSGSSPYGGLGSGGTPSSGSSSSGQQHYDPRMAQYDVQGLYNISPAAGSHDNIAWGAQTGRQGQGQGPSGFM
ncbi:uncharacterized protein SCHCODRAFT_02612407 [Schizophyllum commune H4-8]|uniref:uncharacterized protein n=1 Tax=Schizophyllum commune (strain H4-8 / FGSC 9210) TaxID=578458 RepID=UPI00215F5385|nr:uncharacterized protein SCHCODRAFT_02612407 [Schizophyllum commune H4-8]KAI5898541.1 hypothetical protein SCHCODRAFT_02612407 [Schizophyllum commune H4-8]